MNVERHELTKTGHMQFSHLSGTLDDRLWALALAVYASRPEVPEYHGTVFRGKSKRLKIGPRKGSWEEHFKIRQRIIQEKTTSDP